MSRVPPAPHPSPNFDARPPGTSIDMLVVHYTGMVDCRAALARLCDPAARISAHYLIGEGGTIHALVGEEARAWHAGASAWRGASDVNARSIGIELVNPGHEFGYRAFPEAQMAALVGLADGILGRHPIAARNVVGHADVAPARRADPGELFDWGRLAAAGIGLWPSAPAPADEAGLVAMLAEYGYDTNHAGAAVTAFQRHFRPARLDGRPDGETAGLARALLHLAT
jgi:N-acetylmuramoyl-L-alanine amidase